MLTQKSKIAGRRIECLTNRVLRSILTTDDLKALVKTFLLTAFSLFGFLQSAAGAGIAVFPQDTVSAFESLGRMTVVRGEGVSWSIELLAPQPCRLTPGHSSGSCERVAIWMQSRDGGSLSFIWHPASGILSFSSSGTRLGVARVDVQTGRWWADEWTSVLSSRFESEISSIVEMIRRELVFRPGEPLGELVLDPRYREGEDDMFCYYFPQWCPTGGSTPCTGHRFILVTKFCTSTCNYRYAETRSWAAYENGYTDGSEACGGVCVNDRLCYNPY